MQLEAYEGAAPESGSEREVEKTEPVREHLCFAYGHPHLCPSGTG